MLVLAKSMSVAHLLASDFPWENPRTKNSSVPYIKTLCQFKIRIAVKNGLTIQCQNNSIKTLKLVELEGFMENNK